MRTVKRRVNTENYCAIDLMRKMMNLLYSTMKDWFKSTDESVAFLTKFFWINIFYATKKKRTFGIRKKSFEFNKTKNSAFGGFCYSKNHSHLFSINVNDGSKKLDLLPRTIRINLGLHRICRHLFSNQPPHPPPPPQCGFLLKRNHIFAMLFFIFRLFRKS